MTNETPSARPPRPASVVSNGVGLSGLLFSTIWIIFALTFDQNPMRFWLADVLGDPRWANGGRLSGPTASFVNVLFCGVPMVLWAIFVDKVHRNPTTGIDWDSPPRSWREVLDAVTTKLAGYWATWAIIASFYCIFRYYWRGSYGQAMNYFAAAAPYLFVLSIPYVWWLERRLKETRDGAWHFGALLMGQEGWDKEAIGRHFQTWAVKGFFIAFMVSIVPGNWEHFINWNLDDVQKDPAALAYWLIALMFVLDVAFATVGYILTMKPLDAHIRSATPYAAGWTAALICYPPFVLMGDGGPLEYRVNTYGEEGWAHLLAGHPALLALYGGVLVFLTGIYAWATIIFGLRFSNLTDRGVITNGPYAFTKHPAYLSKNSFWILSTVPFAVSTGSWVDMIRNTVLMFVVAGVYFWRAKTEERHLRNDPAYDVYAAWMADYGLITRWLTPKNWGWFKEKAEGALIATPAE
jgi:Isoprenylcysteine carboxyl methyltransferase (ICMT) family